MEFVLGKEYAGFTLTETWEAKEINSIAFYFEHTATKARLLYLKNNDDNKVFSIGFRTPPVDLCGTPHILEHSVLCGSDKYRLKEPFIELVRSSMSTFINAMTFPDKTVYPVASQNEADLHNLADVYLDAVFNPLMLGDKYAFLQEGWHYHLEDINGPLTINGVVYSEMKGAYSSPDNVLEQACMVSLYPDTCYSMDSGGNPEFIPSLTYEKYVEFYNNHYHPSNSYIYLYGDMDPIGFFEQIGGFLEGYGAIDVSATMPGLQGDFEERRFAKEVYNASKEEDSSYFAINYKIGGALDTELAYAFNVLEGILMDTDSSPLKKALIDSGIASEYVSSYTTSLLEPCFSIIAKNAKSGAVDVFAQVVASTLEDLAKNGIDTDLITSSLNGFEFDLREADSGTYPKGLVFLFDIMDSWLYGGNPTKHLAYEGCLERLRENENSAYYQDLIAKWLLGNKNSSVVELAPKPGLDEERAGALAALLAEKKASTGHGGLVAMEDQTRWLMERQLTPDSREAKDKIPVLPLSKIAANVPCPDFDLSFYSSSRIFTHNAPARGIAYLDLYFPMDISCGEDVSRLELATMILGTYATANFSEEELAKQLGIYIGDLAFVVTSFSDVQNEGKFDAKFGLRIKALSKNVSKIEEFSVEILTSTKIDNATRLLVTINEEISRFESKILTHAHGLAAGRIDAYMSGKGVFDDWHNGISYYNYLAAFAKSIEDGVGDIEIAKLSAVVGKLAKMAPDALIAGETDDLPAIDAAAKAIISKMGTGLVGEGSLDIFEPMGELNEAIVTDSLVNYVGAGTNYRKIGLAYTPKLQVLKNMLSSGYLWEKVRMIGGAYGAFVLIEKNGVFTLVSYRDPKIKETLETYNGIEEHLRRGELAAPDVEKLVISTIAKIDAPLPIYSMARRMLSDYYCNETWQGRMDERQAILSTSSKDLQSLAEWVSIALSKSAICVVGNEASIRSSASIFSTLVEFGVE
ncbi:MAG: insulinase family protein [Eubacteriaceae bacterium]|nr:insulinase family protein [Eubacteriaceae bacterium]